jgi:dTDP-4-amino-4,6-dideoxygalactose transaminase
VTAPASTVPQADPGASYRAHRQEIDAAVARVLASGWYVLGAEGRAFERDFAAWLGAAHAVGCANGTDALVLALRAFGIGPGATVVTVSHTAVATVAAIEMAGAVPLLIDVDPLHYTMDPSELEQVLAEPPAGLPPIRAAIPVHLYGQAADMDAIVPVCRSHGVAVIEDCSQAHGAMLGGRKLGTFGDIGTFSLYPTKNLGAFGDGGVIATGDASLAEWLAALRQYGWRTHYVSDEAGINSRLDEVQAAILSVKLRHLDAANAARERIASRYDAALAGTAIRPPARRADASHVFHQYVVRGTDGSLARDALRARLREQGIGTGIHYPQPVHRQPAYAGRIALGPSLCRASDAAAAEVLSLPMFPELTETQVAAVCNALRSL